MNKSVIVLILAILGCAFALHMQPAYGPSKPGGTYQDQPTAINGTSPNGSTSYAQATILVNGVPYAYTGPFTLACWLPTNTAAPFRYDTCWDAYNCQRMINDYAQCKGTVRKYPPIY